MVKHPNLKFSRNKQMINGEEYVQMVARKSLFSKNVRVTIDAGTKGAWIHSSIKDLTEIIDDQSWVSSEYRIDPPYADESVVLKIEKSFIGVFGGFDVIRGYGDPPYTIQNSAISDSSISQSSILQESRVVSARVKDSVIKSSTLVPNERNFYRFAEHVVTNSKIDNSFLLGELGLEIRDSTISDSHIGAQEIAITDSILDHARNLHPRETLRVVKISNKSVPKDIKFAYNVFINGDVSDSLIIGYGKIPSYFYSTGITERSNFETQINYYGCFGGWMGTGTDFLDMCNMSFQEEELFLSVDGKMVNMREELLRMSKELRRAGVTSSFDKNPSAIPRVDTDTDTALSVPTKPRHIEYDANSSTPLFEVLLDEGRTVFVEGKERMVYPIQATRNHELFGVIKGDRGGYVEVPENVKHNAWIDNESLVVGNARVMDSALVLKSVIAEDAMVEGFSRIIGSKISGNTRIRNTALVVNSEVSAPTGQIFGHIEESTISCEIRVFPAGAVINSQLEGRRQIVFDNESLKDRKVLSQATNSLDEQ